MYKLEYVAASVGNGNKKHQNLTHYLKDTMNLVVSLR